MFLPKQAIGPASTQRGGDKTSEEFPQAQPIVPHASLASATKRAGFSAKTCNWMSWQCGHHNGGSSGALLRFLSPGPHRENLLSTEPELQPQELPDVGLGHMGGALIKKVASGHDAP